VKLLTRGLGGTGLPGDLNARDRGPALDLGDGCLHHVGECAGGFPVYRATVNAGGGLVDDHTVGRANLAHETGLHHAPTVGDGAGDVGHLENGAADRLLAE
jgi:hypothetical protein